ncbi:MAG: 30S ribosomal protein S17 [Candidatus Sungbacteria bacterium]|uniref:Small ribosomal subunit protein uS17 n=1 Tax=Candidatus Sungiibacteriota bacterium TaxID=2750080 RepID=A0A931SB56_9BACT|nr:30S ribosomal protein S17 [Candidatus Sungbacteria bacterium]
MTAENSKTLRRAKGVVVSNKMQKTIVVRVDRLKKHPKYLKYIKTSKRFKAHDEKNEAAIGDTVIIRETRPLSREKRWALEKILKTAPIETVEA